MRPGRRLSSCPLWGSMTKRPVTGARQRVRVPYGFSSTCSLCLGSDKGPQAWPGLLARAGPAARHGSEPCVGRTGSRVFNPAISARVKRSASPRASAAGRSSCATPRARPKDELRRSRCRALDDACARRSARLDLPHSHCPVRARRDRWLASRGSPLTMASTCPCDLALGGALTQSGAQNLTPQIPMGRVIE